MSAIGGIPCTSLHLYRPAGGPWWIEADLIDDREPESGTADVLGARLVGALVPGATGTFGAQRKVRLVAGKGAWSQLLPSRAYANDAGVRARLVAEDAAAACGETLDTADFRPAAEALGAHFTRAAGPASEALEAVAGRGAWWVDFAGVTHVGAALTHTPPPGSYEVLNYDPRGRVATVAIDSLDAVRIGSVLSERLDSPIVVGAYELHVTSDSARMIAWCPSEIARTTEAGDLLERIIERVATRKRFGRYRYRVVGMQGERVLTQIVNKADGLPDQPLCDMMPGVAGTQARLKGSAHVLVEFEGGDVRLPIITGFAEGDVERVAIGGKLEGAADVAFKGAPVEVLLPPAVFSGTVGGAPATGVLSFMAGKGLGAVKSGSTKAGVQP